MIEQLIALIVDESKWLTASILASGSTHGRWTVGLNAWLSFTLLALGLHNLPLALPGFLNIAYHLHSGRVIGWAIIGMTVVVSVGLFIGSLVFLASGQSFEQFSGVSWPAGRRGSDTREEHGARLGWP